MIDANSQIPGDEITEKIQVLEDTEPLQIELYDDNKYGLKPDEIAKKDQIKETINFNDSAALVSYGTGLQRKIVSFSEQSLMKVRTKDLDEVGGVLTGLIVELKGFDATENKGGIGKFFAKLGNQVVSLKTKYDTVEKNVEKVAATLERHRITLTTDVRMLDRLYEENLQYLRDLSIYIAAGKDRLAYEANNTLPELVKKAQASQDQGDVQAARRFKEQLARFDRKLHDLDLTRVIALQMSPQITLIQENNSLLIDKITSSINNTIPAWKNQMVLALGLAHTKAAVKAQREVTDATNEILRKNADILKQSSVETASEAERAIVDVETLKYTNEQLISTLTEIEQIHVEGKKNREAAEIELVSIENELKNKMTEIAAQL